MILSTTCEGEDMVAAARPPPRGVRSDAVDHLQLSAVVVVALLPAEGALGAPPELHPRRLRREEGHEHDIGLPPSPRLPSWRACKGGRLGASTQRCTA
jgi:hypothetical protein